VPGNSPAGWIVKAGDATALAEVLARALQLPDATRATMAEAARSNAAGFSKEVLQKKTLQVYDYLLRTQMENAFASALSRREFAGEGA
jgi:glycosyltransferase involved in cell wall biosynthesis